MRFRIMVHGLTWMILAVMVLSACHPAPTIEITPTPSRSPTQAETANQPTHLPPTSTGTPLPITANPTKEHISFEAGEPFWLGYGKIRKVVFLPGEKQIAIAWGSGVSINNVADGQELWFQPTPADLLAFDVQPQGQMFAAFLTDGSLMILNVDNGQPRLIERNGAEAFWGDIAWSPDGQTIAFQYLDYQTRSSPIYLLDIRTGQISEVPNSQVGEGTDPMLVWSLDSMSITVDSLGEDCPRFVNIHNGEVRMILGEAGHCDMLSTLVFLPGGKTLAVGGQSQAVDLLEFPSGRKISSLEGVPGQALGRLVEFPDAGGSLFFDSQGQRIASRGGYEPCYCGSPNDQSDHPLIVWDMKSREMVAQLERAIEPLAELHRLSAVFDGEEIVMVYENGAITRWTYSDQQAEEHVTAFLPVRPAMAWTLRWSADGSHLAFTGMYGGVDIYSTASRRLVRRFDPPLELPALSPDGSLVALYDPGQQAEVIYQVQSGRLFSKLPATAVLMGASFSLDGKYLAYGDGQMTRVADLSSAKATTLEPAQLSQMGADMAVSRLIWSPDGQALVTVYGVQGGDSVGPGIIVLWKRQEEGTFKEIYHLLNVQANYALPNQVLAPFNPSGRRVALLWMDALEAGHDKLVVYDVEKERVLRSLPEYKPCVWINDDELLAAESQYDVRLTRINVVNGEKTAGNGRDMGDNAYAPGGIFTAQMAVPPLRGVTVRYWRSNEIVGYLDHESLNLIDYSWSPDGRWLASVGDDGTVKVWPVVIR